MTNEEKELLLKDLCKRLPNNPFVKGGNNSDLFKVNVHHFDYRGLIEKGLALEAPEGMYK